MNEQKCEEAVDVDDEVEMSPRTINCNYELESQLNLFVKSDLKDKNNKAGSDITSNSVSAKKRQNGENLRESLPPKKRLSRSRSLPYSNVSNMEELENLHNNEYSDDDITVVHKTLEYEKEEDVRLNQRCKVNIYPLEIWMWNSHSVNPTLVYKEINRVMRIRLRQREQKSEKLQSENEHLNSELKMVKEVAIEREIALSEQVRTL